MSILNKTKIGSFDDNEEDENTGQFIQSYHSKFNYTDIASNDVESLMRYEDAITKTTQTVAKSIVEIGKYLAEAEAVFRKYNEENEEKEPVRYQEWYEALGYNSKTVSVSRRAFEIFQKYGTTVLDFSGKMVEAITSKEMKANPDLQEQIIEKIKTQEIKTVKDVKEYKDKIFEPIKKEKTTLPGVKCSEKEQNTSMDKIEEPEIIENYNNIEEVETIERIKPMEITSEGLEQELISYIESVRYSQEISSEEIYKHLKGLMRKE